jgi:membrane protease YdiL (CAAX protease family)
VRTFWLAWRRHDPNITTVSCVLVGWLLLAQFAAAPAYKLVVTLLPTALVPLKALTAILTVELVVCAALLALIATEQWWQHAGLTTTRSQLAAGLRFGLGWLLSGLLLARLGMVIIRLAGVLDRRTGEEHPQSVLAALVAVAVVEMALTAFAEELLFRGLVFSTLLAAWGTTRRGIYQAAVTSSVLFGTAHLLNEGRVGQLLIYVSFMAAVGLVLAGLRLRTGSIWVGVVLHWANNVTAVLAVVGSVSGWWMRTPGMTPSWMLLGVLVLTALLGLALIESHCQSLEDQPHHDQQESHQQPATVEISATRNEQHTARPGA